MSFLGGSGRNENEMGRGGESTFHFHCLKVSFQHLQPEERLIEMDDSVSKKNPS